MTPREVDELSAVEYAAFWEFLEDDVRERERERKRAQRRGR